MTQTSQPDLTGALQLLLDGRWSCRAYLPDPVPRDQIGRLLGLAQRAASWCNTQPWEVIITEGAGTERFRHALSTHVAEEGGQPAPDIPMPEKYTGVHLERRRESGWQLYQAVGISRGDREASARQAFKNFELFGAPHCAIITIDAGQGAYGALDTGLFVGNFLLAAQSLGLGAIPQAALATRAPFVREFFQIPADRAVLLGISFGWPDRDHPANRYRTSRADLDQVVRWHAD
ncbi:nitroreductase [Nocardia salmonicida]|uniref:nitroreductase n=1 Tax=Nocardia salmonicida TaxID=53431 RepID=UPI0034089723